MKTLWKGQAAVHSKYYLAAMQGGMPLVLLYKPKDGEEERMTIPAEKVYGLGKRSDETYRDQYAQGHYFLVYYKWRKDPDPQEKLF
jgi:hypothetical protein